MVMTCNKCGAFEVKDGNTGGGRSCVCGEKMTNEKHPLEVVREILSNIDAGGWINKKKIDQSLAILSGYMGKTQSCAECERLRVENAALSAAVVDLAKADHNGRMPSIPFTDSPDYEKGFQRNARALSQAIQKHAAVIAEVKGD